MQRTCLDDFETKLKEQAVRAATATTAADASETSSASAEPADSANETEYDADNFWKFVDDQLEELRQELRKLPADQRSEKYRRYAPLAL